MIVRQSNATTPASAATNTSVHYSQRKEMERVICLGKVRQSSHVAMLERSAGVPPGTFSCLLAPAWGTNKKQASTFRSTETFHLHATYGLLVLTGREGWGYRGWGANIHTITPVICGKRYRHGTDIYRHTTYASHTNE
jgi:hypothetical protein